MVCIWAPTEHFGARVSSLVVGPLSVLGFSIYKMGAVIGPTSKYCHEAWES